MHYVWVSERVQSIWGYHCVGTCTSTAVLKIEQCLIDNQCSALLTGVMCEYLVVLATILARLF